MTIKTFKMWQKILSGVVAAVIAVSVVRGNALIPIPTAIAGMLILILLRRKVKEVIVDERVHAIAGKASRVTMQIVGITMGVAAATLLAVNRDASTVPGQIGITLGYATCGLLVIYCLAYAYYQGRLGGE